MLPGRARFEGCSRWAFEGGLKRELRFVHCLRASGVRVPLGGRLSRPWGLDVALGLTGERGRGAECGRSPVSNPGFGGGGTDREHDSLGGDGLATPSHGDPAAELGRRKASRKARRLRSLGGEPLPVLPVLRQHLRGVSSFARGPPRKRRSGDVQVRRIRRSNCWTTGDILGWFAGHASALLHAGHGSVRRKRGFES